MCDRIRHRGPDDDGYFAAPGVALGMRRLSIIDVAGGKQPIQNESGDETIVHLYEERGDAVVDGLRGMFAFAIWDAPRHRLLVARDRLGIKPLYYWETPDGVAFGSELQCISGLPGFRRELDADAVAWYLALGYVPDPRCVFRGVRKLPPGHVLTWDRETGVTVSRYWTPVRAERPELTEQDAIAELRRLIEESVSIHLESEVPLGAFLSGGLDSSTVVATMCKLAAGRVQTFSIGFDEEEFNEAPYAAEVARALGTQHTELIVRPDADELVDSVVTGFDEPFADSSALPTYLVSELARRTVTVALSGDGGDELFGGYTRYRQTLARGTLPGLLRGPLGAVARLMPQGTYGRNRLIDAARSERGQYTATVASPLATAEGGLASRSVARTMPPFEQYLEDPFDESDGRDFMTQMTLVDMLTYLPGDILTKVDRMSMKVSLEARVPLLDHVLTEFAVSLPSALKLRDGSGKWILRRAAGGLVPPVALRTGKRGFAVPLAAWFRGPLRHRLEALTRSRSRLDPWVDRKALERTVAEHLRGRRDHSSVLWRLAVLDLWLAARG
jgi:asparagine synthase (glutamine-hydrolysing)